MRNITKEELKEILELHALWIENKKTGKKADLSNTYLRRVNLSYANLSYANLSYSNLYGSSLRGATLTGANLTETNLRNANLSHVNLYDSDLTCADLTGADLSGAYLRNADLSHANLTGTTLYDANIKGAKNINTVITDEETKFFNNQCPKEGEFVGWKKCVIKVYDNIGCWTDCEEYIVKLLIPSDSKRASATTKKCRCSKAIVLAIYDTEGKEITDKEFEVYSNYYGKFKYKVGQTVVPDKFDEEWWEECSNGIHFFMERERAEKY